MDSWQFYEGFTINLSAVVLALLGLFLSFWDPVLGGCLYMKWNRLYTQYKVGCSYLTSPIISLSTMVLKTLILMFCNTNILMQPKSKKEKATIMNSHSWIFTGLMILLPGNHFSIKNERVFIRFFQLVSEGNWLDFVCG